MAADVARTALGSPSVSLDTSRSAARRVSCNGMLSASCKTPSNPAQAQGPLAPTCRSLDMASSVYIATCAAQNTCRAGRCLKSRPAPLSLGDC